MTLIVSWPSLRRRMVRIELKGIAKATAKGRTYYYAWRGGPRLRGQPGTPEFIASYNEAVESHRSPDQSLFKALVTTYKASAEYKHSPNRRAETGHRGWIGSRIISANFALLNSTGRRRFGRSSDAGATNGPGRHAPLIMECKFYPGCSLMPWTR
jgi:hypothetical protein